MEPKPPTSEMVPTTGLAREQITAVRETILGNAGDSVLPLYLRQGRTPPEQRGSCVLLAVGEHRFALSAVHALDDHKLGRLLVAGKNGLVEIDGTYLRTNHAEVDLGAMKLTPASAEAIGDVPYLSPGELDPNDTVTLGKLYVTVGYPNSRNRYIDNAALVAHSRRYAYVGKGLGPLESIQYGWHEESHVLVSYIRDASVNDDGKKSMAPDPTGNSGGAVFAIDRQQLKLDPVQHQPKLVGIMILYRPNPGAIVATRIGAAQALIASSYPETAPMFKPALRLRINAVQSKL